MKNPALDFKSFEQTISVITNPEIKHFFQAFHQKVSSTITERATHQFNIGYNSPTQMYNEYSSLFTQLHKEAKDTEPTQFFQKYKDISIKLKSGLLEKALKEVSLQEYDRLTEENLKKMRESREENMRVRDDYSVYTLTTVAYATYLKMISALIPGVDYDIPTGLLMLASFSVLAVQATSPYESFQEAYQHIRDNSDRIISNSGLRKCLFLGYRLTEKISIGLAETIEPYVNGAKPL